MSSRLLLIAGVIAIQALIVMPVARAPGTSLPRMPDGKPNLNGIWQAAAVEANWDLQAHASEPGPPGFGAVFGRPAGVGVVEGNDIPYQPWALARKNENYQQRYALDPEAKCQMPGVPRATYMPFPFQIVQGASKMLVTYEFADATRAINLDKPLPAPGNSPMGWSNGRWDWDTLVVDVTGLTDQTWLDRAGNFHSDALHVVERYALETADAMRYEATIEDPKVFTRPWKITLVLYRRLEKNRPLLEFHCLPFAEEMVSRQRSQPKSD
jgi:hypothetical protein